MPNQLALPLILCLLWQPPVPQAEPQSPEKDRTRIFVSDSKSWEISGGFGVAADSSGGGSGVSGGARPQTAEIIKTFNERCPTFTVTMKQDRADYVILLDHEGGKFFFNRDNKIAVFKRDGDSIFSVSTRSLGNAVKDACSAIAKDATHSK